MKSWSVASRFTSSILIFSIPLVALIYYLYQAASEQILFSAKEVEGSQVFSQLGEFQAAAIAAHFSVIAGGVDLSEAEKTKLEKQWAEVLAGSSLDEKKVNGLKSSFSLYLSSNIDEKKAGGRFLIFNQSLSAAREAIADGYNIILDPDLDSYYTMDLIVNWLPQLQEYYLQLSQFVGGADDIMYDFQKKRLVASQAAFEKIVKNILNDLDKVHAEDSNFYGVNDVFQSKYAAYQDNVREQLREIYSLVINADRTLTSQQETWKKISTLSNANATLTNDLSQDFQGFLDARMSSLLGHRNRQLAISILAMLAAIFISAYFGLTIHRTIKVFHTAVINLKEDAKVALDVGQSLTSSSAKVSQSSSTQAAAIEQTSASLEELSSMVAINAQNSGSAKGLASEAKDFAVRGASEMQNLNRSMNEIAEGSKKIEEIMQIIDDIAFQTNLLALNASVEAARAGEHGKGFAVVADAVRSLALKSASSAKEIGDLITESLNKIENGKLSADRTGRAMQSILSSIEKVTALSIEIASASQEQTAGIQQISKAVTELEQTTIENSGVARVTSDYSNKALQQAEGLLKIVDVLESELKGREKNGDTKEEFNFQDAIQAHLKWKARLKNYISGVSEEKLESNVVCKDDQCPLGKWIHGPGKIHNQLSSYSVLKKEHSLFHKAAGDILQQIEKGQEISLKSIEAGSEFDKRTQSTILAIQNLNRDIGKS